MFLNWMKSFVSDWRQRQLQGRVPHAVLLAGRQGLGKRCAAAWMARNRFGLDGANDLPRYPLHIPEYADLHWVSIPDDRQSIGIDQVRELVTEMSLTSYEGNGKVAVIEPADRMTESAANSLLKTLEEPPGDALIVLIADRSGGLPATILSRCQRVAFRVPDPAASLAWLRDHDADIDWERALAQAAGAPLAAIAAGERLDQAETMASEFAALAEGRGSVLEIAGRWSGIEPYRVLEWLARQVQSVIRQAAGVPDGRSTGLSDSVLRRIDRQNLFCYLDTINGLRAQSPGSFNPALTLESLLIQWSGGLASTGQAHPPGDLLPGTRTG